MVSTSKLEELKRQLRDTSNQQMQIQEKIDSTKETLLLRKQEKEENREELMNFFRSVMGQSELIAAKERELFKDKLDKSNHLQQVMNEQIIKLNDNLTDTSSLEAVYKAKREELELNYQNQKKALDGQIKCLKERLSSVESEISQKKQELEDERKKLEDLIKEKRLKNFIISTGYVVVIILVVIAFILLIEWLGNGISGLFGGIVQWFNNLPNQA